MARYRLEEYNRNIPDEVLLEDLRRVARILGSQTIRGVDYVKHGRFAQTTFRNRFDSWKAALDIVGLSRARGWKTPNEELFANIEDLWMKLGRQPHKSDLETELSKFSFNAYVSRFGRWRTALEQFVSWAEGQDAEPYVSSTHAPTPGKRTPRQVSDRLRARVLLRDGATCRLCGARPEDGAKLHVDHIVPWSKGGETTLENLQILCERCNVGKSDMQINQLPNNAGGPDSTSSPGWER